MIDESPIITLTHYHDGRVLAVVVDGVHWTPQEVKDALEERQALLAELDRVRAALAAAVGS